MTRFDILEHHLIPVESGQAVAAGWMGYAGNKPRGVTWHWTATRDLASCDRILGGATSLRKGEASAHYGIGRSFAEGVSRYVSLENRSWHAGKNQTLRWDGQPARTGGQWWSGSRTTIGVETVNLGYARTGVIAGPDWIECVSPSGKQEMQVQPWTAEQIVMMIAVGKEIVRRWPHIGVRDHHGHHDICPGYKVDVCGFPFAEVLRGIYDAPSTPDVWTPLWTTTARQRCLRTLGYQLGDSGPGRDGVDGDWGRLSDAALRRFQRENRLVDNGMWSTFVCWRVHEVLSARGSSIEAAVAA
ncbi:peptidoglycan recognition protein family protein [Haliangium sp.]|uniref:peptidoglycan recognition protein family protein n=1 Tax=Haliangium sp. TaxID=2663208 RepID=UPI003D1008F9